MTDDKPIDPDQLLRSIVNEQKREKRGLLRIFFGMCPGVGKTYAMLQAAQEHKRNGSEVLVGIVETHSRKETLAVLDGLEVLKRKRIDYRGKDFDELDVELILKRRPKLVLIDELAHTNVPGSRHSKRYHDVNEILDAGIDVFTTVNVQHVESRVDLVKQITGVTVSETVPDSFFEMADQIELIDLPPTELLKRLKEGKIYLGDMAQRAIDGFFQQEHLLALRELALRFTAELVEGELNDQMLRKHIVGPWNTREKLLVAISHSPYSRRLIRATRRKAFNLEAKWIALYIDTGEPLSEEDRTTLGKHFDMARELGAELVTVRDTDVPSAIRRIAEEKNVTQIVMGRPDRRFFSDLFSGGTILDKLVSETSEIDIHVLRQVRKPKRSAFGFKLKLPEPLQDFTSYSNTLLAIAVVSTIGYGLEPIIKYQAVGFILLLTVIAVAGFVRRGPTLFAALVSALTWNYFFIPPKFTFAIKEVADVMMIVAYFAVAITASFLTSKIRRQADELKKRAHQTALLYEFSSELASASGIESIGTLTTQFVERTLGGMCRLTIQSGDGTLKDCGYQESAFRPDEKQLAVAHWVVLNCKKAGIGTETLSASGVFCLPVKGTKSTLGVLLFYPSNTKRVLMEEESVLQSAAASIAISLERELLQRQTETLRIVEESEKLYQTILDSVSHELRTPITSILGAATALEDPMTARNENNRKPLTEEIVRASRRLNHVVENLLDTSRMSMGKLDLKKELVGLYEAVQAIVSDWKQLEQTPLRVTVEGEEVYAAVDTGLLRSAVENLLHNALKYSSGNEIRVSIRPAEGAMASISVADEGEGIPEHELTKLFDKFYRRAGTPTGGVGLGLSIAKGIVEAHGGQISARRRSDKKGTVFVITLPAWQDKVPNI